MDFVAVVEQVTALLRQRGRVAYRTLQRQFQLDDEALADLRAELAFPVKTRNFVRWGYPGALAETATLINLCF